MPKKVKKEYKRRPLSAREKEMESKRDDERFKKAKKEDIQKFKKKKQQWKRKHATEAAQPKFVEHALKSYDYVKELGLDPDAPTNVFGLHGLDQVKAGIVADIRLTGLSVKETGKIYRHSLFTNVKGQRKHKTEQAIDVRDRPIPTIKTGGHWGQGLDWSTADHPPSYKPYGEMAGKTVKFRYKQKPKLGKVKR